jgi:hypothetical protein
MPRTRLFVEVVFRCPLPECHVQVEPPPVGIVKHDTDFVYRDVQSLQGTALRQFAVIQQNQADKC